MDRMAMMASDLHQEVQAQVGDGDLRLGAGIVLGGVHFQDTGGGQQGDGGQVGEEGPRQGGQEVVRPQQQEAPSHGCCQDRGGEEEQAAEQEDLQEPVQGGGAGPEMCRR